MAEPITVVSILSGMAVAVKAAFDWGAHHARARADVEAAALKAAADTAQASATDHTAEVTEREGWRKRTTALETQVSKMADQIAVMQSERERFRDEKFALQDHILTLQTQINKLSEQLAAASTREALLKTQIAELTVEMVALRVELQKYKDGEEHHHGNQSPS